MEKLAQTLAVDQPSNLIFPQVKGGFSGKVRGACLLAYFQTFRRKLSAKHSNECSCPFFFAEPSRNLLNPPLSQVDRVPMSKNSRLDRMKNPK